MLVVFFCWSPAPWVTSSPLPPPILTSYQPPWSGGEEGIPSFVTCPTVLLGWGGQTGQDLLPLPAPSHSQGDSPGAVLGW